MKHIPPLLLYIFLANGAYLFLTLSTIPAFIVYMVLFSMVLWSHMRVSFDTEGLIPRNKDTFKASKLHPKDLEILRFLAQFRAEAH
jgi:hypothetical protein